MHSTLHRRDALVLVAGSAESATRVLLLAPEHAEASADRVRELGKRLSGYIEGAAIWMVCAAPDGEDVPDTPDPRHTIRRLSVWQMRRVWRLAAGRQWDTVVLASTATRR